MQTDKLLDELIQTLTILPGVGPKSAQRMAYSLLQKRRQEGLQLATSLQQAMLKIRHCNQCRTFTENEICSICMSFKRQQYRQLCIVEMPSDIAAIENTGQYFGLYFVLLGKLSPLDGIGPKELGLELLKNKIQHQEFDELIIAVNPSVEGEATANYISNMCADYQIEITRIAHGIPIGGELDNIDGTTLTHSFLGRRKI